MKIIKEGDFDQVFHLDFECGGCGCEFLATSDEYEVVDQPDLHSDFASIAICSCPCCGKKATRNY